MARGENHKALREYQGLLRKGLKRSELHCNLGNALLRDGHPGWAVVYYEKGLLVAPTDSQIQKNELMALRSSTQWQATDRKIETDFRDQLAALCDILAVVAMSMLLASCLLTGLAAWGPLSAAKPKLITWAKIISWSFGTLFLISTGILLSRSYPHKAIVMGNVPGRSGPSENATKVAQLYLGEKVQVENQFQGWIKIKRRSGEESWLAEANVVNLND